MPSSAPYLHTSDAVTHAQVEDEVVLLNLEDGIYFSLDAIGARIWDLLTAGTTRDRIVAAILAEYEADPAEVERDVDAFLDQLLARRLVREVTGAQE